MSYHLATSEPRRDERGKIDWSAVCSAKLDYFGRRVTYCVLDRKHVDDGRLHVSASGIKWCCNGKDEHCADCVRSAGEPSVS